MITVSPIVQREVRIEARNRWNYLLRLIGAGGCSFVAWAILRQAIEPSAALGVRLFSSIHTALLSGIWILVPVLTADCLSREKREGTLGLLFLAGLRSESIVLGKGCVHMVRALALWLAAFPVVMIPLFLGGIGPLDVVSAFTLQGCAMLLALAAGLVASGLMVHPIWSVVWAQIWSCALAWVFKSVVGLSVNYSSDGVLANVLFGGYQNPRSLGTYFITGVLEEEKTWSGVFSAATRALQPAWLGTLGSLVLLSFTTFIFCLVGAAWRVRIDWQDRPATNRQVRWRHFWLTPRFWNVHFSRLRRRVLDRNPMGWLERRTTNRRVIVLLWCFLIVFVNGWLAAQSKPWFYFYAAQMWMAVLLTLTIASAAATVFRWERESGTLELLLVTPISVDRLIMGRWLAFWRRFMWPVALLVGISRVFVWRDLASPPDFSVNSFLVLNFLATPVIGFWVSLRLRSFTSAFVVLVLLTVGLTGLLPELCVRVIGGINLLEPPWFFNLIASAPSLPGWTIRGTQIVEIAAAVLCWHGSRRMLAERTFITKSELIEPPVPRAVKWQSA